MLLSALQIVEWPQTSSMMNESTPASSSKPPGGDAGHVADVSRVNFAGDMHDNMGQPGHNRGGESRRPCRRAGQAGPRSCWTYRPAK